MMRLFFGGNVLPQVIALIPVSKREATICKYVGPDKKDGLSDVDYCY
jgi:hypothetical protein